MESAIQRYEDSHQHPVNRALHVVGLPLIGFSFAVFGRAIRICSFLTVTDFLALMYIRNYYEHDPSTLIPMTLLFTSMNAAAYYSLHVPHIYAYCVLMQALGWVLQIMGHRFFEKNSPVFLDSLSDSVSAAPLVIYRELRRISFMPKKK